MGAITVIRDPQLELTPIEHPLQSPSEQELGEAPGNPSEIQQTKVFGLLCPILALNSVAVDWMDIEKFELDFTSTVPRVRFAFHDRASILNKFSNPGNDNELRIEIIPPVDNTYKKINLSMICNEIGIVDGVCRGTGELMVPEFTKSQFKGYGQKTTFEIFDMISTETGLGFASNIEATEDTRYIQCQHQSYKDLLDNEIEKSGSSETHVYDWWIDAWNNLVLCDLYDRVNDEDSEEDMKIWATANVNAASVNSDPEPVETLAIFTNHPAYENSDLYVTGYNVQNAPATQARGNAVVLSVYEENKKEYIDHYIADGDIQKNEFIRFEYAGEVYGDYNYLIAQKAREVYLKKVKSEVVVIHTTKPQLSIMRGDQLRFVWYDGDMYNSMVQDNLEEVGGVRTKDDLKSEIGWLAEWDLHDEVTDNPMRLNMQYSGQYTCIGQYIIYSKNTNSWDCWLYLTRPASKRPKILNDLDKK